MVLRSQCRHPTLSPASLSEIIFVLLVREASKEQRGREPFSGTYSSTQHLGQK